MQRFDYATATTQGGRSYQEDSTRVWPDQADRGSEASADAGAGPVNGTCCIATLADGMGGHTGGARASRTVCDSFVEHFHTAEGETAARLVASLKAANQAVHSATDEDPLLDGMGSTLIGAVFNGTGVEWISVGDSPLMLYRRGEIALLNEDHSLAPELDRLAAAGHISPEQAKHDPRRHMLRSAITGQDIELVDVSRNPLVLEKGDYIILASDGLHALELTEISRIVDAYGDDGAQAVSDALIRAVERVRDPHQDNATVIAVRPLDVA